MVPELRSLEERFAGQPFTVVGVHSSKFYTEQEAKHIRQAVMRYHIEHPVVVDAGFRIWQSYGVRAWPTLVLIDPEGYVVGSVSGEGNQVVLERAIGQVLEAHAGRGTLSHAALPLQRERLSLPATPLSFPGKVLASAEAGLLAAADTNHNRIVLATLDGRLLDVAGSGAAGLDDGDFASATFRQPQGLALVGRLLYVADTENHAIRRLDLRRRRVAGTGRQARGWLRGGRALGADLNSPWDLCAVGREIYVADGLLYVADTYNHKIKRIGPATRAVAAFLGDGQPGLVDGAGGEARFYEPGGITACDGRLYVADTYNHAIRVADIAARTVSTLTIEGLTAPAAGG